MVDDTVELFTPAVKIDEMWAVVEDLRCHIYRVKYFQGILHKQIFVNKRYRCPPAGGYTLSRFVEVERRSGTRLPIMAEIVFRIRTESDRYACGRSLIDITVRLFRQSADHGAAGTTKLCLPNPLAFIARGTGKGEKTVFSEMKRNRDFLPV